MVPCVSRSAGADLILAFAVARPFIRLVLTRLPADDLDLGGNHERGIKSNAELTDQVRILALIAGKLFHEAPGPGSGYGPQVLLQIFFIHADPGIGYGEGLTLFFVKINVDPRIKSDLFKRFIGKRQVLEPIQCIRSVGNELPYENLLMRIEGMYDEMKKLVYFGLKFMLRHMCLLYIEK